MLYLIFLFHIPENARDTSCPFLDQTSPISTQIWFRTRNVGNFSRWLFPHQYLYHMLYLFVKCPVVDIYGILKLIIQMRMPIAANFNTRAHFLGSSISMIRLQKMSNKHKIKLLIRWRGRHEQLMISNHIAFCSINQDVYKEKAENAKRKSYCITNTITLHLEHTCDSDAIPQAFGKSSFAVVT